MQNVSHILIENQSSDRKQFCTDLFKPKTMVKTFSESDQIFCSYESLSLFIYLGFYVAFNTVQVIS